MAEIPYRGLERRRARREKVSIPSSLTILHPDDPSKESRPIEVTVWSISHMGAGIELDEVRADGLHIASTPSMIETSVVILSLPCPPDSTPVRLQGAVIWYDLAPDESERKFKAGIEFTDIDSEDQRRVEDLLREIKKQNESP